MILCVCVHLLLLYTLASHILGMYVVYCMDVLCRCRLYRFSVCLSSTIYFLSSGLYTRFLSGEGGGGGADNIVVRDTSLALGACPPEN